MKRCCLLLLGLVALVVGCQKEHPISVFVDPDFVKVAEGVSVVDKIAVLPFASALNTADDPDGMAPRTMNRLFTPLLDARRDYSFISPGTVHFAVEREGWLGRYDKFLTEYSKTDVPDTKFLMELAGALRCDAFLVPVVDTWYKDEVDVNENASASTTVGATITIIDAKESPGKILFRATDETYLESAYSEAEDRGVIRDASGAIRADRGAKVFRAPNYDDVAVKVCEVLAICLPPR